MAFRILQSLRDGILLFLILKRINQSLMPLRIHAGNKHAFFIKKPEGKKIPVFPFIFSVERTWRADIGPGSNFIAHEYTQPAVKVGNIMSLNQSFFEGLDLPLKFGQCLGVLQTALEPLPEFLPPVQNIRAFFKPYTA